MSIKSFFSTTKTPVEIKIDAETMRLLDITTKRKEAEMDLKQAHLQLRNTRLDQELDLKKERHTHELKLASAKEEVIRAKKIAAESSANLKIRLQEEHSLEKDKLQVYLKLEAEQKTAQIDLDHKKALARLQKTHEDEINKANTENTASMARIQITNAENIAKVKSDLAKEYYDKMQDALAKMTLEGSNQSHFIQELALKMFDKPSLPAIAELKVSTGDSKDA